jgi:hypothetical protein
MALRNPISANDAAVSNRSPFDRNCQSEHRRSSRKSQAISAGAVARWEYVR